MNEFFSDRHVKKTKKQHPCIACGEAIPQSSAALYFATKWEGEFYTGYYHIECKEAEIALNDLHGLHGLHDEWMNLTDIESEDYAWLRDKYPVVAARIIRAEQVA